MSSYDDDRYWGRERYRYPLDGISRSRSYVGDIEFFPAVSLEEERNKLIQESNKQAERQESPKGSEMSAVTTNKIQTTIEQGVTKTSKEVKEAGKRVAVEKSWMVIRASVFDKIINQLPQDQKNSVKALLDNPLGDILLRIAASVALEQLNDKRAVFLAEELRVQGYELGLNHIISPLSKIVAESLKDLDVFVAPSE